MSEANQPEPRTVPFDYTQARYWGGPWYPYWSLIVITVFGGFFGLDHLYLRSPTTAILKLIFNIFGLGLWYFYDLIQIFGEKQNVTQFGLSAPIFGPLGIGAGMFTDSYPRGVETSRSPFRYLAYLTLLGIPFGFDYLVAGDTNGALVKFLTGFIPLLWPIAFFWTAYNVFRAFFMPKHLFDNGMYRFFPFNWFMDSYGLSKLGPIDQPQPRPPDNCDPGGSKGMFRSIYNFLFGWIETVLIPIITLFVRSVINIVLPGVQPAVVATSAAVQTGATAAGTIATAAGTAASAAGKVASAAGTFGANVIQAASTPVVKTTSVASQVVQKGPEGFSQLGSAATSASKKLNSFATPSGLKDLAKNTPAAAASAAAPIAYNSSGSVVQKGGAMLLENSIHFDTTTLILFLFFTTILASGTYFAIRRLNNNLPLFQKKKEDERSERNDTPPKP
jgi:hypothetical protein